MNDTLKTKKQLIDELAKLRSELAQARRQTDDPGTRNPDDAVRQQVEEMLQLSTEQWFTVFNVISNAICLIDPDGRIQRCNKAMVEILDKPLSEILGRPCWEVIHGASKPEEGCPFVRMKESLGKESAVITLGNKCYDVSVEPIPGQDNEHPGAVHVMTDISEHVHTEEERARTEKALRQSQQQIATLMSNLPGMAYRCLNEPGWRMEFVSEGCISLTGYAPSELIDGEGPTFGDLIHPQDRDMVWDTIQECVKAKEPYVIEYRLRDRQGKERWVWERGQAVGRDSAGTAILEGFVSDITERVRIEKARIEAQDKLRENERILNATGKMGRIGGWEHDLTTRKAVWTEALYDIVEIPYDQTPPGVDEHLDYYPPDDRKMLERAYTRAVEEGIPFDLELEAHTAKNKLIWCRAQGEPVYDEKGNCTAMRGTFQDITQRKQAETALQRQARSLTLINQAAQALGASLDPNQVLKTVLEEARRLLDITASSIWLIDPETEELVCRQATGPKSDAIIGWRLKPGEGIAGWVAAHDESLIVPDAEKDERHASNVDQQIGLAVRSIVSAPLRARRSAIGVLQMVDVARERFDAKDLQAIEPLAALAANAIENAHLYQQARQSEVALKQAQQVAHVGSWKWHIPSNRLEWSDEMYRIFGIEKETFSGELSDVIERAIHPDDREVVERSNRSVIQHQKPIPVEYRIIHPDGTVRTVWAEAGELIVDDDGNPAALTGIVQDITERKQAELALKHYVERLRTLRAIDGAILAAWSPDDIAGAVLRHIRTLIPCQRACVTAADVDAGEAHVLALSSDSETSIKAGARIPIEAAGIDDTLLKGQAHVVQDITALSQISKMEQRLQDAGMRSYVNVPLVAQGVLVGSLTLGATTPDGFSPEHVDIAAELANQMAIAIRQARLFEQVQHHAEELEQQVAARTAQLTRRTTQLQVAAEVARDATRAHDLDELLNRSVNLVQDRFGFYHAGIFLTDKAGAEGESEYAVLRAATGEAGRKMLEHGHKLKVGQLGIVGHVCADGEPRTVLNVGADAVHFANPLLPDTHAEMALPMRVGENIIGALDVQSTEESTFLPDDVEILQVMADQLAVAIERTRLFEQMQATLEKRLHTIISNAPVILFALDPKGEFTLAEGRGLELLGLKPADLPGRSAVEVYDSVSASAEGLMRALRGEANAETVEGNGLVFNIRYTPIHDENGEVTGVIGVATDVTERHRMQKRMQQQERLAAVGQLAGGIAHDFNNFLTTIIFYAHMLLNDPDGTRDVVPIGETIVGEAKRAAELVRQVLDFSRRSVMETEPVDLTAFVAQVLDMLTKTLPENIRVVTDIGKGDHVVEIDPTRIQQVIVNLALNARDAMPEGGELHIGLARMTVDSTETGPAGMPEAGLEAGDWVCLSVRDTGTGMDEHVRAHLFEPFFTTKGAEGNGLGLAQVYGIVKQHRGEIAVNTIVGQGTTFRIFLPARASALPQWEESEKRVDIPEGKGETILLVEDEKQMQKAAQQVLQSLGYRVITASNGAEGLEAFKKTDQVDLVITDMVMPKMGGRELIQELERIAPGIKAIVMTGYTIPEDIQALRESRLANVLHKPLDVHVLGKAVRQMLDDE